MLGLQQGLPPSRAYRHVGLTTMQGVQQGLPPCRACSRAYHNVGLAAGLTTIWGLPPCRAYRHVGLAAGLDSLCYGIDQVARNTKVAHLDLAAPIDEDVGRLHVPVDHLQLRVQVVKCTHNLTDRY